MKLLYKTKKWDNEIKELEDVMRKLKKHSDLDMSQSNIQSVIESFLYPDPDSLIPSVDDESTFWYLVGSEYNLWSGRDYQLSRNEAACLGHMYLYISAMSKAYGLWKAGVELTNEAVLLDMQRNKEISMHCFSAIAIDEFPLFERYAEGDGRIIAAMFHEEYDIVWNLVNQLPDTKIMYQKNKNYMSYYYEAVFLKDLYVSILEQNEEAFNEALAARIKNVRGGYVMPIDVVSIAMIKFARKRGLQSKIDVIEIPTFFLGNKLEIDKEKYKLFDFDNPIIV